MNFRVAIDIGVASVGWAVVADDMKVIDAGARLFNSADPSKNVERREKRGTKRLQRRKAHRLVRFDLFWQNKGLDLPGKKLDNPLELRNKGIKEKIELVELYTVLRNMLKHRGISYMDDAIDDNITGNYQQALNSNAQKLATKYPCEIQLERYNKYHSYRGDDIVSDSTKEQQTLSNVFTINGYLKELNKLFEVQQEYNSIIDEEFIEEYITLFVSKRKYYDGPGNEKSRTDYGRYTTKIDSKTGEYITDENLFEKLIGKCSVYQDEFRASSASYTAQEFNVLNDLNNLVINGRKLERTEKCKIIEKMLTSSSMRIRSFIKDVIGETIESMTGARIDSKDKEIFHTFEAYREMKKGLLTIDYDISDLSREELDEIGHILTINTDKESIIRAFELSELNIDSNIMDMLISIRKKKGMLFNKWHSLSLKIMNELVEELYIKSSNQMVLLTEMGVFKSNIELYKGLSKIPTNIVLEDLFNPVVRKSVKQSIDLLNMILKTYGEPLEIIVEMARDKNEEEQRKRIKDIQGKNKDELEQIIKKIESEYGIQVTSEDYYQHKTLKTKLRLWNEQEGKCLYSGKPINIVDLIKNNSDFEIDHVIPISISFDDSRKNKVLVYRSENQIKGNRTPYMYLSSLNRSWNFNQYAAHVNGLEKKKLITPYKKRNLMFRENITKQEVLKGFIQRNINDTRYASKVVLNSIQKFMNANDKDTKVKVIRGSFTSQLRKRLNLPKDRDESYAHHAVDSMIMCFAQMGLDSFMISQKEVIDFETGEILDQKEYDKMSDEKKYNHHMFYKQLMEIKIRIKEAERKVKYSHKIDKKVNRKLTNETIYGVREGVDGKKYKISKIKDIYDNNGCEAFLKKIKGKKAGSEFLMFHHDPESFKILLQVKEQYADQKNPFAAYVEHNNEKIRKYSKKNNGPFIKSLKYYDGEVGSHLDISHKYGFPKGSKKVILDSLKPFRTDVYYRQEDNTYHLAGIKYVNFKFVKGEYILDKESYNQILISEKILNDGQSYVDVEEYGYKFLFSLYKNDIILYEKEGEEHIERFLSRTMFPRKNYIETKPVESGKFNGKNRKCFSIAKTSKIRKINTDILGNHYYCKKEKFIIKFKLDS